jgi:hypothetical protein
LSFLYEPTFRRSVTSIRATKIGELGTTLAVINNRSPLRRNTVFFAACFGW